MSEHSAQSTGETGACTSESGSGAVLFSNVGAKVIDFHTHMIPRSWPVFARRYGYQGFVHIDHDQEKVQMAGNARLVRDNQTLCEVAPNSWDAAIRVRDMDRAGVDIQVVSIVPELFFYWAKADDAADSARILNNGIAEEIKKFPGRFVALGTLPLQAPGLAIAEMERCMLELSFAGVVIGTHVNEWQLDAPELIPFWVAAEELGACVFVHPNLSDATTEDCESMPQLVGSSAETCHAVTSVLTSGLLDSFPSLKVCFAYGAGTFPYVRGQLEHGMATGRKSADLKPLVETLEPGLYKGRFFCDSLVHSVSAAQFLIQSMTSDAVLFGSDYPYPLGHGSKCAGFGESQYNVDPAISLPFLDQVALKKVMGANAANLISTNSFNSAELT